MQDHITISHKLTELILDWWQVSLAVIGMAIGVFVWWLHQIFTTKVHTELCKTDLVAALHEQKEDILLEIKNHEDREERNLLEHRVVHSQEHSEIRDDLRWIRKYLHGQNEDS